MKHRFGSLLLGSYLLGCGIAQADQWFMEPKVRLHLFHDSNVQLAASNPKASLGTFLTGNLTGGRRTENTEVSLGLEALRRQYLNASDLNAIELAVHGNASLESEADRYGLEVEYRRDSSLSSEIATSGLVQKRVNRRKISLTPSWRHNVDERTSIELSAGLQDVAYDNGIPFGLFDYRYGSIGLGLVRGISERTQASLRAALDEFRITDLDRGARTLTLTAGFSHNWTETWTIGASGGWRRTRSFGVVPASSNNGYLFDVSLTGKRETATFRAAASRTLLPSGNGEILVTDKAQLDWKEDLGGNWRWAMSTELYRNGSASGASSSRDRRYLDIRPRLSYRWDRKWRAEAGYRYRYQKYDQTAGEAQSHLVFFDLIYSDPSER